MDVDKVLEEVAGLVFTNPFGERRRKVECLLLGDSSGELSFSARAQGISKMAIDALISISGNGGFSIQNIRTFDRDTIILVWLFYLYHKFYKELEEHIRAQEKAGSKPLKLKPGKNLVNEFAVAGFKPEEADHYIALMFQVSRAFYYIDGQVRGSGPAIVGLRKRLWNNLFTANPKWYFAHLSGRLEDFATLILGETGTGKSLVARILGRAGYIPFDRVSSRFVESFTAAFNSINLAQYPSSLLESELFGHKKGSFTGAIDNYEGIFARCSRHGAVFIDEIGDVDIPTQVKLLQVIQEREYSPVGSREKRRFSGRIIAATNQDLEDLISKGKFRKDLYFRVCSDIMKLPSLSERVSESPEELGILIRDILQIILQSPDEAIAQAIESTLLNSLPEKYPWRGNIRELEQSLRQICISGKFQIAMLDADAPKDLQQTVFEKLPELQELSAEYCYYLHQKLGSYEAVARTAGIDRRTAKKYVDNWMAQFEPV